VGLGGYSQDCQLLWISLLSSRMRAAAGLRRRDRITEELATQPRGLVPCAPGKKNSGNAPVSQEAAPTRLAAHFRTFRVPPRRLQLPTGLWACSTESSLEVYLSFSDRAVR
jgi:hypothetical protein